jgi:hypothetical protein
MLKPAGVPTDAAVAIGLLWFLATIVSGLIGGVLFLLDRKPSAAPASVIPLPTAQAANAAARR